MVYSILCACIILDQQLNHTYMPVAYVPQLRHRLSLHGVLFVHDRLCYIVKIIFSTNTNEAYI